jgi:pilus assembly protein CpaB
VTPRRRRGLLLLSVGLASGGLAASQVHERERRAAEQLGPSVAVLVATRDLRAGVRIGPEAVALRSVPARFAPPDVLTSGARVLGARTAVPVAAGSYMNEGLFAGGERPEERGLRRGQRAVTVEVAGGTVAGLAPGARVDVLVSTETGADGGRTSMPLAGAELLRLDGTAGDGYTDSDGDPDTSRGQAALATLRVSLRQAIYLTAADNFAREIRLLSRPPRDPSRAGAAVTQGQL